MLDVYAVDLSAPLQDEMEIHFGSFNHELIQSLYYDGVQDTMFTPNARFNTDYPPENEDEYHRKIRRTTLGMLACYADVIGVGRVEIIIGEKFRVTVEHALTGCAVGDIIELTATEVYCLHVLDLEPNMPVNNSRIVFAAFQDYAQKKRPFYLGEKKYPYVYKSGQQLHLLSINRCWWHVDRDNGELYKHFTNIIQAVRFEPDWENFYNLCSQAALSKSNRVREDAFWDIYGLVWLATHEQEHIINEDPLVNSKNKSLLFRKDWKSSRIRELKELPLFSIKCDNFILYHGYYINYSTDSNLNFWDVILNASTEQIRHLGKKPGLTQKQKDYLHDYLLIHDYNNMIFWPSCDKSHEISVFNSEEYLTAFIGTKVEFFNVKKPTHSFFNFTNLFFLIYVFVVVGGIMLWGGRWERL